MKVMFVHYNLRWLNCLVIFIANSFLKSETSLQITSLLLEAELRKLSTLQSELESSSQSLIIESDNEKREEQEEQQLDLILAIS